MQGVASGSWPALAGAPTIGTATAGALSASVTFTAPTYVGSGITGYTATSSPGGITGTGSSSPIVVSGLTAGTAYTFTVTATTAAGQGSASAASNSVTPTLPQYIEDAFSTYLYTGNSSAQTITNGIDLAGKGGMVWLKSRTSASVNNLWDTVRAPYYYLQSNDSVAQQSVGSSNALTAYNSNGFTVTGGSNAWNGSPNTYVSWTFAEQAKFFDVLTYTGNGTAGRTITHNLGSVPGCIIVKAYSVDTGDFWGVYHRSLGATKAIFLSATNASVTSSTYWNDTEPTSTNFTVGDWSGVNQNGTSYVAYIYAHNAGGFGLTGTDNVISCGSFTSGSTPVNLGWEPQFVLIKRTSGTSPWVIADEMRGFYTDITSADLYPNTSEAEVVDGSGLYKSATGFTYTGYSGSTFIYIAIRRGPMKVPTVGTTVFNPIATTGDPSNVNVGFPTDLYIENRRDGASGKWTLSRLTGGPQYLSTNTTNAEATYAGTKFDLQNFFTGAALIGGSASIVSYMFKRAPSFFDQVCYTGTGSDITLTHNLQTVPQLMIFKERNNGTAGWFTFFNLGVSNFRQLYLNREDSDFAAYNYNSYYLTAAPTSTSVFAKADSGFGLSVSARTYVAYLFATCAGVSKVDSYTGNGTTQTIDCGFTGGARFVLIKRYGTSAPNSGWYVYDTARGMTVLTDPYSFFSLAAAETATLGSVTTVATGFALNSAVLADINASGGTYIFLAIA